MALLRVENLSIRPRRRHPWLPHRQIRRKLIDDISFEIEAGSITGLVGDTGSGKLALAMAILRIQRASGGAIYFDGGKADLLKLSERRFRPFRRQIQLLLPDDLDPLNPHQNIAAQMRQLVRLHERGLGSAECDSRIEQAAEAAELPSALLQRRPGQMIGAHRLRAAIARALVAGPRLLICYDITTAIDMTVQAEILNLLKDLRERFGLTLFFITHDLAVADHMSDHMLILNRGRIVESGTPKDIVERPEHDYTRRLVASTTSLR